MCTSVFGVRCSTFDIQMPVSEIRLTSTYEPVQRSPFMVPSDTPSAPIGVVPSNIASGCVSAVAIFPGLMPRGYTLPSLAGFCSCPEQDITPFLPLYHFPSLPFTHSLTSSPVQPFTNSLTHSLNYLFSHSTSLPLVCSPTHCVTGWCQRQRRDRYCNAGIYPGGMTCLQAVRVPEARFMGSPEAMITTLSLLSGTFRNPGHQAEFRHKLFRWNKCIWIPHSGAYP
jgi:hypothetical protein